MSGSDAWKKRASKCCMQAVGMPKGDIINTHSLHTRISTQMRAEHNQTANWEDPNRFHRAVSCAQRGKRQASDPKPGGNQQLQELHCWLTHRCVFSQMAACERDSSIGNVNAPLQATPKQNSIHVNSYNDYVL